MNDPIPPGHAEPGTPEPETLLPLCPRCGAMLRRWGNLAYWRCDQHGVVLQPDWAER